MSTTKILAQPPVYAPTNEGMSLKAIIGLSLASAVVIGAGIHFTNKTIKKNKTNKSLIKSFKDGTPQTIARRIKMAFENNGAWGTDVVKLREIMLSLKSQEQWDKVVIEYGVQYGSNLIDDLKSELTSSENDEMLYIKDSKPLKEGGIVTKLTVYTTWAKRLKSAFDQSYLFFSGTDTNAIRAVFSEVPNQHDFIMTAAMYQKEYRREFLKDLKSELSNSEYNEVMTVIFKKPKK